MFVLSSFITCSYLYSKLGNEKLTSVERLRPVPHSRGASIPQITLRLKKFEKNLKFLKRFKGLLQIIKWQRHFGKKSVLVQL